MNQNNYFLEKIQEIIAHSKPANNGLGCMLWEGAKRGEYGVKRLTPPGHKSTTPTVHRALYICHTQKVKIPPGKDVSHLCHVNLCVNINHLVLEDHTTNMGRLECHNDRVCSGKHQPPCIL